MATVDYGAKSVSDENVKSVLQKLATALGKDVKVSSGDRDSVPSGGSKTSLHLSKRAADFSVTGETLEAAFQSIKDKRKDIFDADKKYECIHHGSHTETSGAHLHIGRFETGAGVDFKTEGLTADTKGKYTVTKMTVD